MRKPKVLSKDTSAPMGYDAVISGGRCEGCEFLKPHSEDCIMPEHMIDAGHTCVGTDRSDELDVRFESRFPRDGWQHVDFRCSIEHISEVLVYIRPLKKGRFWCVHGECGVRSMQEEWVPDDDLRFAIDAIVHTLLKARHGALDETENGEASVRCEPKQLKSCADCDLDESACDTCRAGHAITANDTNKAGGGPER